jgi:hypothetical protein
MWQVISSRSWLANQQPQGDTHMGFITKQFLEGEAVRNRKYEPAKVKISGESHPSADDSEFGMRNGFVNVAFYIRAATHPSGWAENGDYQEMFLTKEEVDKLLPEMVEVGEKSTRLKIALAVLSGLTDKLDFGHLGRITNSVR